GAVLSESRDRAVDEPWISGLHAGEIDAELRHRAHPEVLDQHVYAFRQAEEDFLPLGMLEIEDHALLVAVEGDEVGRVLAVERRPPQPRDVARGRLDLDDLVAVVGEPGRG